MCRSVAIAVVQALLFCGSGCTDERSKAPEEPTPKGIVFHRKAAGEPGPDGWYEAKSTHGGFSVLLPGPFNDFTQSIVSTLNDGKITTHAVGLLSPNGVKYMVTAVSSPDGKAFPNSFKSFMEEFASKEEKRGNLKSKRELVWEGQPGVELYLKEANRTTKMRGFELEGTRYTVMADFPNDADPEVLPDVDKFLASLKLQK